MSSTSQYQTALRVLFDPTESSVKLLSPLSVNEKERTITAIIQSRGVLQLPWRPIVKAYESTIVYKVDNDDLIYEQSQTWSKSAWQALKESFTPNVFGTAPKSPFQPLPNEPRQVTKLFELVNGRRPSDYAPNEQLEIDTLVDSIVEQHYPWKRALLPGKWILVYLQPGPDGGGIDRRVPFPEFDFNDSFQVFGQDDSVVNIGEVLGPNLRVEVGGDLMEANVTSLQVPKRFIAHIHGGKLCAFENTCVSLPISGEGLFDGVYLGERLRIGQNINGGGARVVQLRLE